MAQYQSFPGAPGDSLTLDKLKRLGLPNLAGRTFLDVGCNEGFFCGFADFQGASRVVGIDRSPEFIERARARFPQCEFHARGWEHLPEGEFDIILLASALHYAEDQPALIHALVERLSRDGVLVLELGIASSPRNEWIKVKRGIDERWFPTMPMLREVLASYAWKWMGPSIRQDGDPVPRHVIHISRKRPMAYLLMEPPGYGKSTIAASLFAPGHVPVVSGDECIHRVAEGKAHASEELRGLLSDGYSPFELDRIIDRIFDAGLSDDLLDLWLEGIDGRDFALDVYVPQAHHATIERSLAEAGYFPVSLRWNRLAPGSPPAKELVGCAEAFYLSMAGGTAGDPHGDDKTAPSFQQVGFVDEVTLQDGHLVVRGWAIDRTGHMPSSIGVRSASGIVKVREIERQLRPDVQRHLSLPHALVGYRFRLPALQLKQVNDLKGAFEVFSTSETGEEVVFQLASALGRSIGASNTDASV